MRKLLKKGFTIVELVVVIAVIAILAAVLIPTFSGVIDKANQSAALQTARSTLTSALNMSSNGALAGHTADGTKKTVFCVNGYAFDYNANSLNAFDYPTGTAAHLKHGSAATDNFNAILIAAENLVPTATGASSYTIANVGDVIYSSKDICATDCTNASVDKVDGRYYLAFTPAVLWAAGDADIGSHTAGEVKTPASWEAEVYLNSDFSNKVVVFTTFAA